MFMNVHSDEVRKTFFFFVQGYMTLSAVNCTFLITRRVFPKRFRSAHSQSSDRFPELVLKQ